MRPHKLFASLLGLSITLSSPLCAQSKSSWRAATTGELTAALPARAPVERERIETEMRTASGIIDTHGRLIAGVVLITAGYSAEGKYSHYLLVQAPISFENVALSPGSYVIGWTRKEDSLSVAFYDAATGVKRGTASAHHLEIGSRVESFRLWPPADHTFLQIGRFAIPYTLQE
ncbi:hypothetical protein [Edaphobacter modestus]|uniref:Uncharacterized protein n=1 Tax=Edaphobacter modestus TaxID=388466 RepID=A0A4Q7YZT0_9BACT|nr:hypothetical protein [Edaphobacter modestus]RZU42695.1 hypothetical protein BDD14_4287 [Edaphobacter modestus]